MAKVKIHTANMNDWIKNETRKMIRHTEKVAKEVALIKMHSYVAEWYRYNGNEDHVYSSIANSLRARTGGIYNSGNMVKMDIILSVDASLYAARTAHYNIYSPSYVGGQSMTEEQKFQLTFGQQWADGVIGLPPTDRNGNHWPHLQASISLEDFVEDLFKSEWNTSGTKRMITTRINRMM